MKRCLSDEKSIILGGSIKEAFFQQSIRDYLGKPVLNTPEAGGFYAAFCEIPHGVLGKLLEMRLGPKLSHVLKLLQRRVCENKLTLKLFQFMESSCTFL